MIVPSIDLMDGRAVQLRQGREYVLDGGDPLKRLEEFAVAGEVAVVDLDAALGRGSNAPVIERMIRRAPCRVGGGIRDLDTARRWLDAGARRVVIGTAATPAFCAALPRDRVIAAVDAERGEVVVEGWRHRTGRSPFDVIDSLAPVVGGFLLTQVEHEGGLAGFDLALVERAAALAGEARVTAAGGITTARDIAALDRLGVDAQVGMALYSGRLPLADAVMAPLRPTADSGALWPTVVTDQSGVALGLVWSSPASLRHAIETRQGVYWSRSRNRLWVKGAESGNTQQLLRVDLDCDRDTLRFAVRQQGAGFCHQDTRTCWGDRFGLEALERTITSRVTKVSPGSGTARLLADPVLLRAKLLEEAGELADAVGAEATASEAADVLYFTLATLASRGTSLAQVVAELEQRSLRITRRPMQARS